MRYGVIPEDPVERLGMAAGLIPTPMFEGYGAAFARTLMVATRLGVFDALAPGPATAAEIAERCGTDAGATEKLANLLVGMRHLSVTNDGAYRLTRSSRRWLLADGDASIRDMVLMKFQRDAGLEPRKPLHLFPGQGPVLQIGLRPA